MTTALVIFLTGTVAATVLGAQGRVGRDAADRDLGRSIADRDRLEALQHYRAGEAALRNEHFEDAAREFQRAEKLDPALELAPYGLGQVFMATRRYREAVIAYTRCRDVFRANGAMALQDEAARQQRIDDQIRAIEDAKRGYEMGIARTANTQATIERLQTQINQLKYQRRRSEDRPQEVPAWISIALGGAYFRAGEMIEAEREYRETLKVDPKLGEAHNNLAVVCMLTGRFQEADAEIKAAEKAGFRVNPQLKADLKSRCGACEN